MSSIRVTIPLEEAQDTHRAMVGAHEKLRSWPVYRTEDEALFKALVILNDRISSAITDAECPVDSE